MTNQAEEPTRAQLEKMLDYRKRNHPQRHDIFWREVKGIVGAIGNRTLILRRLYAWLDSPRTNLHHVTNGCVRDFVGERAYAIAAVLSAGGNEYLVERLGDDIETFVSKRIRFQAVKFGQLRADEFAKKFYRSDDLAAEVREFFKSGYRDTVPTLVVAWNSEGGVERATTTYPRTVRLGSGLLVHYYYWNSYPRGKMVIAAGEVCEHMRGVHGLPHIYHEKMPTLRHFNVPIGTGETLIEEHILLNYDKE